MCTGRKLSTPVTQEGSFLVMWPLSFVSRSLGQRSENNGEGFDAQDLEEMQATSASPKQTAGRERTSAV